LSSFYATDDAIIAAYGRPGLPGEAALDVAIRLADGSTVGSNERLLGQSDY
jgi:hypothetical protein